MSGFLLSLPASGTAAEPFPAPGQIAGQGRNFPDPLLMFDGSKVATKDDWFNKRRPEARKALFEHYMYGRRPGAQADSAAKVNYEDPKAYGGKATRGEVVVTVDGYDKSKINVLLAIPNGRKAPVPVFVGMNFSGNHSLVKDPKVLLPTAWVYPSHPGVTDNKATDAGRGTAVDVWNIDLIIDRGYAVATFYSGDVDPDRPDKAARAFVRSCRARGRPAATRQRPSWPGRGVIRGSSITSSPTRRSTPRKSLRSAIPAWARRPCSRRPSTTASHWPFRTRRGAAAPVR